jgi:hypothetical protein
LEKQEASLSIRKRLVISFCNPPRQRRFFGIAVLDLETRQIRFVRAWLTGSDLGVTGMVARDGVLYLAVPNRRGNHVIAVDPCSWKLVQDFPLRHVTDVHSLAARDDALYICSSGDNAVYRLELDGQRIVSESLHWRFPGAADDQDDVHLNCLAFHKGNLVVSCFGRRDENGRWAGSYGVVMDTDTGRTLARDLAQPHTVLSLGDRLVYAESRRGRIVLGDGESASWQALDVWGYTRGIAVSGDTAWVGVSAARQISKSRQTKECTPADAYDSSDLARLDLVSGEVEKFEELTACGREVYDIIEIECAWPSRMTAPFGHRRVERYYVDALRRLRF